jgi:uncharacterized membrane protein
MQIAILYVSTALVFLVLDAVMLKAVLRPIFERQIGPWLLDDIRIGPAIGFYLVYIAGLLWFVSLPALRSGEAWQALLGGAILGAMAYGTYEFTNYATLRAWSWNLVAVDLAWGIALTALSAWVGVVVTRALS